MKYILSGLYSVSEEAKLDLHSRNKFFLRNKPVKVQIEVDTVYNYISMNIAQHGKVFIDKVNFHYFNKNFKRIK